MSRIDLTRATALNAFWLIGSLALIAMALVLSFR